MTSEPICPKTAVISGILLFVVIAFLSLDNSIKVQHDSGIYISLGKAIVSTQGYKNVFRPSNPPHTHYPPIFPLLLTLPVTVFGYDFLAMKLMMIAFAVGALWVLYYLLRQCVPAGIASLVILFTATSHGILFYSQSIMTEIPYLLFSLLALLWLRQHLPQREWSWTTIVVTTLLISLVYLTRLVGISLLGAMVTALVFEGQGRFGTRLRRGLAIGGIVAVPALLWFTRNWLLSESVSPVYWDGYTLSSSNEFLISVEGAPIIIERLVSNLYKYSVHFGKVICFWAPAPVATALAACVFVGFLWQSFRERTILEYYIVCYMCIVVLFPGTRPQRYVVPLIPFVWLYFVIFARVLYHCIRNQGRWLVFERDSELRWAVNLVLVILLVVNTGTAVWGNIVREGREDYYHVTGENGYTTVLPWVRQHTKGDHTFLWAKPSLRFLLAGRKAYRVGTKEGALGLLREGKVDYVVVDEFSEGSKMLIEPMVSENPRRFELTYENEVSKVYRVQKEPSAAGAELRKRTPKGRTVERFE